ncbi:hypothetical protein [Roseibium sp. RKSG952]|uniref:hypothetical protein n=1 Tax=Roseibium sp. RKSG952 TaxID=2529384 RepID=UPI0012BC8F9D|nr:hypothetical protein [Roseibium sp. RKSG952]MTH95623.1 hypothetical protein [Roseibium sp. RKSG952]
MDERISEILSNHATATVKSSGGEKPSSLSHWIRTLAKNVPAVALTVVAAVGTYSVMTSFDPDITTHAQTTEAGPLDVSPDGPTYLKPEFFEVAVRTIQHNTLLSGREAAEIVDAMEDLGQGCKTNANTQGERCVFHAHGVTLDFDRELYRATANPVARDGSIVFRKHIVTAEQRGDNLRLTDEEIFWNNIKGP